MTEDLKEVKVQKKYKSVYYNDPAYRAKHLQRMSEKVPCVCGAKITRANVAKHTRTSKHQSKITKPDQMVEKLETQLKASKMVIHALTELLADKKATVK